MRGQQDLWSAHDQSNNANTLFQEDSNLHPN